MRQIHRIGALCLLLTACGDDSTTAEVGSETDATESGDGDGDPGDGDGDGDPGDGDGDPGDGDDDPGDGDGDGDPGDGDGDGDTGDGDGDTGDGDGDTGDGDGDPAECDPAAFLGYGVAADGWGIGDFCDWAFVCTDQAGVQALLDAGVACVDGEFGCAPGQQVCEFAAGYIDEASYDDACVSLSVEGIDAVYCGVLGG